MWIELCTLPYELLNEANQVGTLGCYDFTTVIIMEAYNGVGIVASTDGVASLFLSL